MRYLLFIIVIYFIIVKTVLAQQSVFINEFMIEPTPQSVELINVGNESIDISHWYIDDSGGTTYFTIPDNSLLYPNSCLVFNGEFNLNKTSADAVRLFDNTAPPTSTSAMLQDSFSYKLSASSGISYMRIPDGSNQWATGSATLGKYNGTDNSCIVLPSPTPTLAVTPNPTVTPIAGPISYGNIFLSEVMVNPTANENEWIELFNNNDFEVNLDKWFIDDQADAGSTPKQISLIIPPYGYAVWEFSSSIFNNSGDTVRLLDFNKQEKDSFEYSQSIPGQSLGRSRWENDEFCEQEPSKGNSNNSCTSISITSTTATPSTPLRKTTSNSTTKLSAGNVLGMTTTKQHIKPLVSKNHSDLLPSVPNNPVMTVTTDNQPTAALSKSLSFSSFSFTLLSIISMVLKIKSSIG